MNRIRHWFSGHRFEVKSAYAVSATGAPDRIYTRVLRECALCGEYDEQLLTGNHMIAFQHLNEKRDIDELRRIYEK